MKMKFKIGNIPSLIAVFAVLFFLISSDFAKAADPEPKNPSKRDKCPVCGMFVYKYPDWTAQIIFKDGTDVFFDGCKDMFKYYFAMNKYSPGRKPEDIVAIYVSEYYEMKSISGMDAYFVVGSDVYGPMGNELIPLETKNDAETFMNDHKGTGALEFREVTRKVIDGLD